MPKRTEAQRPSAVVQTERASDSGPFGTPEVSSSRPLLDRVPGAWLNELLMVTADLPLSSGEGAVLEAIVQCLATILPSHAVGGSLVTERRRARPLVVKRVPRGWRREFGEAPGRIFDSLKHEYVASIPGGAMGSTLHLASDVDELDPESSTAVHLLDRAAIVLGAALPKARAAALVATAAQPSSEGFADRLIQLDKLATFGELAASIVHELNNPLTSIVAYSDYLIREASQGPGPDADRIERLRRISESANRILSFTRELVGYARPSDGKAGTVVLQSVVDRAVTFCEHLLSASGVEVERRYEAEKLSVHGVSEQLVQVFVNLLTNACQAVPSRGGHIRVHTARSLGPPSRGIVVIEDNGSGIAPDNLPHIFVPFFTTKREQSGTGLGLSIIKNIVEAHGGTIRVDSLPAQGARFTIELPCL
jgi:signal transduction histidine kinase